MVALISHDDELTGFRSPVCSPLYEETKQASAWPFTSIFASSLHSCIAKSVRPPGSCHKVRMVLSILKRSVSAEGAVPLLLISLGTGLDQIGTVLPVKVLRQTNQAPQACSSTTVITKKQNYFDFSFCVFPQLLCSRRCVSLGLKHFRDFIDKR